MVLDKEKSMFIRGKLTEEQMKALDQANPGWLALDAYSENEKEYLCVAYVCGLLSEEEKNRIVSRAPHFVWKSRLDYERKVAEWKMNVLGTAVAQPDFSTRMDGYAIGWFDAMMCVVQAARRGIERMERDGLEEVIETVVIKIAQ